MGDHLKVDASGLQTLAARCDSTSMALSTPAIPVSGPPDQATTVAATQAHQLVQMVLASFANRATDTATATRSAAANYTGTDQDSAQDLAAVGQSVRG